jgi:hypothetical protein
MATTKMRPLTFSIHGDYLTDIVRQVWVEGEMTKAIHILKSGFPMFKMDLIMDIILGKKKLVGINEMVIEDDNATECCGIPLLSMDQQIEKREKALKVREEKMLALEEMRNGVIENIPSIYGLIPVPCSLLQSYSSCTGRNKYGFKDGFTNEMYAEWFPEQVEYAKQKLDTAMVQRRIKDTMLAAGISSNLANSLIENPIKTLDSVISKATGKPSIDKDLNGLNGWISPDGDFYSCGFMEHIDLADSLGFSEGEIEKTWVKVRDREDPRGFAEIRKCLPHDFMLPNKITQSQFDTIYSWCQKHGRNTPEDIETYIQD